MAKVLIAAELDNIPIGDYVVSVILEQATPSGPAKIGGSAASFHVDGPVVLPPAVATPTVLVQ